MMTTTDATAYALYARTAYILLVGITQVVANRNLLLAEPSHLSEQAALDSCHQDDLKCIGSRWASRLWWFMAKRIIAQRLDKYPSDPPRQGFGTVATLVACGMKGSSPSLPLLSLTWACSFTSARSPEDLSILQVLTIKICRVLDSAGQNTSGKE